MKMAVSFSLLKQCGQLHIVMLESIKAAFYSAIPDHMRTCDFCVSIVQGHIIFCRLMQSAH
jgi:hypothetical protein